MGSLLGWHQVTIKQFLQLAEINQDLEKVDKDMWALSILTGKEFDYYESMPNAEREALTAKLNWMDIPPNSEQNRPFKLKGKRYKFTVNKHELNAHQFAAVQKLFQEEGIKNIHKILAYLSVELTWMGKPKKVKDLVATYEARAELFLNHLSIEIAMGNLLFFSLYLTKSLKAILPYLQEEVARVTGQYGWTLPTNLPTETH